MEHSYARAGGGGGTGAGTHLLLVRRAPRCPDCHTQGAHDDDIIDIETVDNEPIPPLMLDELPYWEKALVDCDMIGEEEDLKPDWEEKLHSQAWNAAQSDLLDEALTIIHNTRAALLTAGVAGARRVAARGGGARSLRALLAAPQTRWQPSLAQWLHNALTENLPTPLLACYREIMLTMKSKVPVLVEKMTIGHPLTGRIQGAENGAGGPMIASANAPSDPSAPILLLVPSGRDKRDARWAERLRAVAQVHIVHSHQSSWPPDLPISSCLANLMAPARTRAESLKMEYPHRPLVLVGQGPGAAIAVQMAVTITGVSGVICLGLPLLTADGPRGTPEDCLLDIPCPVLFVFGQNASNCSQQDAEALRCKLRVRSRLVIAGGADDLLRLPRLKRQLEGVTQRMLECAIADEVSSFLTYLSQREDDGIACSSPESYGGPDREREYTNSPPLLIPKREPSAVNRMWSSSNPIQHKKKKMKHNLVKNISPIKSRGSALYEVNNPPPEGASIIIGDILNTKVTLDDDPPTVNRNSLSPPSKQSEPSSFIQIKNNRLTRSIIPITGNGSYDTISKGSGIKVLENIPYKTPAVSGNIMKSAISGPAGTPLVLPPRRIQRLQTPVDEQQVSSISSTNIMDLPIVFADDNRPLDESKLFNQQSTSSSMKTIIINKQQVITSVSNPNASNVDIKMRNVMSSGPQTSRGIIQMKMPQGSTLSQSTSSTSQINPLKYTKLFVTKKQLGDVGRIADVSSEIPKNQIINKPIIVKNKGSFKVIPSNLFQKQPFIIKRAVVQSGLNVNPTSGDVKKNTETPKVDGDSLRENSKNESAIEAAVASITDQPDYLKNMLENFD